MPPALSLGPAEKTVSVVFAQLCWVFMHCDKISPKLARPQGKQSCFSLPHPYQVLQALNGFDGPACWFLSSMRVSISVVLGCQHWCQHSRAEYRAVQSIIPCPHCLCASSILHQFVCAAILEACEQTDLG